eukprot:5340640-Prymnesium_polylepis.1
MTPEQLREYFDQSKYGILLDWVAIRYTRKLDLSFDKRRAVQQLRLTGRDGTSVPVTFQVHARAVAVAAGVPCGRGGRGRLPLLLRCAFCKTGPAPPSLCSRSPHPTRLLASHTWRVCASRGQMSQYKVDEADAASADVWLIDQLLVKSVDL